MEVSSNTNNIQLQNQVQQQNAKPQQDPTYSNKEVSEASQGNLHRNNDGEIAVTAQGKTNINNAKDDKTTELSAEVQANKDSQRETATNVLAAQSKKSQVEIYLAVATQGKDNPIENNTASIIESLRDVQKQNKAVEAFATYQQNQNAPVSNLSRGLAG